MEQSITIPLSLLTSADLTDTEGDLALYYQFTSATPTVKARLVDGTLKVRKGSSQIFAAAHRAGVVRVQAWVSTEDLEAMRSLMGDLITSVGTDQLESEAYATTVPDEHLLVFDGSVPSEQMTHLRNLMVQFFTPLPTLQTQQTDSITYVLFTADTPTGDPTWLRRWVAALVDARQSGL